MNNAAVNFQVQGFDGQVFSLLLGGDLGVVSGVLGNTMYRRPFHLASQILGSDLVVSSLSDPYMAISRDQARNTPSNPFCEPDPSVSSNSCELHAREVL